MLDRRRGGDEVAEFSRYLSEEIGARPPGSKGEALAAAYIDGLLRRAGMRVWIDAFGIRRGANRLWPLLIGLALAATLLGIFLPLAAALLLLVPALAALLELLGVRLPYLGRRGQSTNVVGTRGAQQRARWRLLLLAPLDSKPQLGVWAALSSNSLNGRLGLVLASLLAGGLCLLQLREPGLAWRLLLGLPALLLLVLLVAALVEQLAPYQPDPGRATALALLVGLAERQTSLRHVELWTIGVGAPASGNAGVQDLLRRYPFEEEPARTLFVTLESIERGSLIYTTRHGPSAGRSADALLLRALADADAAEPLVDAEPRARTTPGALINAIRPPLRSVAILSVPAATPERGNVATHERALRLIRALIQQLEQIDG